MNQAKVGYLLYNVNNLYKSGSSYDYVFYIFCLSFSTDWWIWLFICIHSWFCSYFCAYRIICYLVTVWQYWNDFMKCMNLITSFCRFIWKLRVVALVIFFIISKNINHHAKNHNIMKSFNAIYTETYIHGGMSKTMDDYGNCWHIHKYI